VGGTGGEYMAELKLDTAGVDRDAEEFHALLERQEADFARRAARVKDLYGTDSLTTSFFDGERSMLQFVHDMFHGYFGKNDSTWEEVE
jgi:hypothetical protein